MLSSEQYCYSRRNVIIFNEMERADHRAYYHRASWNEEAMKKRLLQFQCYHNIQKGPKKCMHTLIELIYGRLFNMNEMQRTVRNVILSQKMVLVTLMPEPPYRMARQSNKMAAEQSVYIFWTALYVLLGNVMFLCTGVIKPMRDVRFPRL
jgi:hypothetical protein